MKDFIVEYLLSTSPQVIVISVLIILFAIWIIFCNRKNIHSFFDDIYNKRQKREELLQTIKSNQEDIKTITNVQKNLSKSLSDISKKIDDMQKRTDERFEESEKKNKKRIRAELKDKISQSYRYYHSIGKINDMELEALEDLIEEYEEANGKNSFVHSVVQKEMYIWEKIDRI